jgi:HK97 family phage portal protein
MALRDLFGQRAAAPYRPLDLPEREPAAGHANGVRADGGAVTLYDLNSPEAAAFLRGGGMTEAGVVVNDAAALRIAAAWRCLHIRAGVPGNMPLELMERVSERERRPATGHPVRELLATRPNSWQTPQDFKRMLTAHAVQRGNGYAMKVTSRGRVIELWPIHPDRIQPRQLSDMSVVYDYTSPAGRKQTLTQADVFHLRGLSLDGVVGLGVLAFARQTMGLALQQQTTAAHLFKQGVMAGGALKTASRLSQEAVDRLRQQMDDRNAGAENAHKWLILEEGLEAEGIGMSAEDMQFLEGRSFERTDIAMFYGVPPHMIGDTAKSTSWGSGIDSQTQGFVTFTAEDDLTMWEEAVARDLLGPAERGRFYARYNRSALVRGDINTRWGAYVRALQWGVYSPNEVRALEDQNPRDGGDVYYPPPNTAGDAGASDSPPKEPGNDPKPQP